MAETTDHDTLTRLTVQMEHLVTQQAADGKQGARIEGKVDALSAQLASVETRTTTLEGRPLPVLAAAEGQQLVIEHREMYGFYSTFRGYIYPLILSGPVSAVISALLTFAIIHASK